jgi:hypothetical protein
VTNTQQYQQTLSIHVQSIKKSVRLVTDRCKLDNI